MAQDFERAIAFDANDDINIGTTARTVVTSNSDDAIVGIRLANIHTAQITVDVFVATAAAGGTDQNCYLIKGAPIPVGSTLQILDGGAKIVMVSGDALKVKSSVNSSADVWVSVVDTISE